jgi:glyoxylase-like metal-dependent hydrolase (beta-lactamase superfamily II)
LPTRTSLVKRRYGKHLPRAKECTMADDLAFKKTMVFDYGVPSELAPGVQRIVANNPSPFTFKGTNTYLVGSATDAKADLALIDPGPTLDDHIAAIKRAIGPRRVSHILITHTHRDHTDALPKVQAMTGAVVVGYGRTAMVKDDPRRSPSGTEFIDADFNPDLRMVHGDSLSGPGWKLDAVFTPGHAPDHLCFALADRRILFSGDHVMAWNTTVVAPPEGHMGDYMTSLETLLARGSHDDVYLPGHGGRVEQPARLVKAFLVHRSMREHAILGAIKDGTNTIDAIVARIYQGLDPKLTRAASMSVQAHVEHLVAKGLLAKPVAALTWSGPLVAV